MAYAATTQWEVRTTGNDANGGGFDTASSGTDYSQQDTAQISYTDLVIGATNTQLTSALNPFTSAHVGNLINVTGGTGFTTGRYQVVSVASNVATMDRAVGTAGSTGGAGKLGGALATPDPAIAAIVATASGGFGPNNTIWIKAGTYTRTTSLDMTSMNSARPVSLIGYQTTHGDRGTKPLITTATNSTILIQAGSGPHSFINLQLTTTATTKAAGIANKGFTNSETGGIIVEGCILDGFTVAVDGGNGSGVFAAAVSLFGTEIKNCTNAAKAWFDLVALDCYIHNNSGDALTKTTAGGATDSATIIGCTFYNNARAIVTPSGCMTTVKNCNFVSHTSDAIAMTGLVYNMPPLALENSIFWGGAGYGVNLPSLSPSGQNITLVNRNNAYGSNTSGARNNFAAGTGDVTLTADPFTSSSTGDFSLNSTSGGGAVCQGAGFAGLVGGSNNIGAVQSAAGGGGSAIYLLDSELPDGTLGNSYSQTVAANGGTGPYTFAVTSGSLPASLSLNSSTGVISGTPTATGTSSFTITATDSASATGSQAFSITVNPRPAVNYGWIG
jgi:hypothetical protein